MAKSLAEKLKNAGIDASRGVVTFVDPDALTLIRDKKHILYDPRVDQPLIETRVQDIDDNGVTTPLLVRENGMQDGVPILEIVAGRRRKLHVDEANRRRVKRGAPRHKVPVFFVHGTDAEMLILAIRENAQREDESFFSLAWKIRAALSTGLSEKEVSASCNVGLQKLKRLLAFLNLSAAAQKAITEHEIPFGSIDAISDIPREKQAEFIEELKAKGVTKSHEVEKAKEAKQSGGSYTPPERKKSWGRRELSSFQKALEAGPKNKETIVARALVDFILGDDKALAEFDALKTAASTVRKAMRKAAANKEAGRG